MADYEILTYAELAERLGLTVDGARHRVKRRGWPIEPGNYPGAPCRVRVPVAMMSARRSGGQSPNVPPGNDRAQEPNDRRSFTDHSITPTQPRPAQKGPDMVPVSVLREMLDRQERQHIAEIARLERMHRVATESLMAKIAALLVAQRRRPWWVELFGTSRRSDLKG